MRFRSGALNRRQLIALGGAAILAGTTQGPARAAPVTELSGAAFGTQWIVTLPSGAGSSELKASLAAMLERIDIAFSPWRGDSCIARFNRGAANQAEITDEIATVARTALDLAEASDGRFDPTVGPMVARWGFGPISKGETRPDGWRDIAVGNGHLARMSSGLTLDFCGIAKGYALDRMVAVLLEAGHEHFLIDLGGELAARGRHPSGRSWHVGVENPHLDAEGTIGVLRLDGMAVATSGDRRNGYDIGTRRYSHIIDPSTGEPVESSLSSVSVIMPTAMEADGWATALMAAGAAAPELARTRNISALFLFRDGDNLGRMTTGDAAKYLL